MNADSGMTLAAEATPAKMPGPLPKSNTTPKVPVWEWIAWLWM